MSDKPDTPMSLLAEIAKVDPTYARETDGDPACIYCHLSAALFSETANGHEPDCLWLRAKKLAEPPK